MLHDPARHEPLRPLAWDEGQVQAAIEHIVGDTESRFTPEHHWPMHPPDRSSDDAARQVQTRPHHGDRVAGIGAHRLALMPRPRGGEWLRDEVRAWRHAGVKSAMPLLEPHEAREPNLNRRSRGVAMPDTAAQAAWAERFARRQSS